MKNKLLLFTIIFVLITSGATLNYYIQNKKFMSSYVAELDSLNSTIEKNEKTLQTLQSNLEYNSSKEFIEKVAREKLGLVMNDEIIFKEN